MHIQTYSFHQSKALLYVPDSQWIQHQYYNQKEEKPHTPFPYWSQVWPAAIGLCLFITRYPTYVVNKNVLELSAGLGLPSIIAASFARQVYCTDYLKEAVDVIQQSITLNRLTNMEAGVLDWEHLPEETEADVLFLSDINYEPAAFELLHGILTRFLNKGTTVLLSTPQRLVGKPFIDRLLDYCTQHEEITVPHSQLEVPISIMVLKKQR